MAASRVSIVPALPEHCDLLAANLRHGDRAEVQAAGLSRYRAVGHAFRNGVMCRTAFVDGDIAAMWGLGGGLLSATGTPWLLTTAAAERVPFAYVRIGRAQVAAMLALRPVLVNYVAANYDRAIRFLELLGFTLDDPAPFGDRDALFRRFELRRDGI